MRIRGGEANHTLILVDGVSVGTDAFGNYTLSGLEVTNIDRIEVLRGPQSAIYGSDASSGVINIITRRGDIGSEYQATFETGGATTATVFASNRDDQGGVSASLSYANDHGYDVSGSNGERDELLRQTLALSGDYFVTDHLQLGFGLRVSDENYDYDAFGGGTNPATYITDDPNLFSIRNELVASVFADYSMMQGRMAHRLAYETSEYEQQVDANPSTTTQINALNYRFGYALDGQNLNMSNHLLNVLIEASQDSNSTNPSFNRDRLSYGAEYRGSLANGLDVQLGARFDDNDVFENATVWTAAVSYAWANGVRVHGSAGVGYVNPSYGELFDTAFTTGNPNLVPEQNEGFDIGVEIPVLAGRGVVDITYFNETLVDEIAYSFTSTPNYNNEFGESDRQGIEIEGNFEISDAVGINLNYTFLDATDVTGAPEARRPDHEALVGVNVAIANGRGTVSADMRYVSSTYSLGNQAQEIPSYVTVNLAGRYDLSDMVTVTGRIENLFDEDYYEVFGYATRPVTAYIGFERRF